MSFDHLPPAVQRVFERFVGEFPGRVREIKQAVENGDSIDAAKRIHKLKGAAGACGFYDLVNDISALEDALQVEGGREEAVKPKLEALEKAVSQCGGSAVSSF